MDESPAGASHIDNAAVHRPVALALAAFVVGYNLSHHNGLIGSASAGVSNTRVADWVDLATPFVVLGPLLGFLALMSPTRRWWVVAAAGCITYVEGHGIHLAANSISNVADPDAITWATNALEGGTAVLSLILAATAVVVSLRDRRGLATALIGAGVVASLIISVYGLTNSGFPQPSSR